ncbi:LysR substrate-binding domain-containing protein [Pseudomonas oryzihabitans]|uniref:LysR family transcriptional regulator n=2 Tax=Pseudomonas oryzihabitans TaxID=47885 RepID=A0ABX3IRH7_9PSED|nr:MULTISPECIES: LysR substrate-binding domain-containing protein [Pseudomonas]ONN70232.1 LysR family transcriptional regulator [Pseudomonas psychrotolerans]QEU03540.1 LysR family transcriptional regulator [Pseudomonas oryzihabitans]
MSVRDIEVFRVVMNAGSTSKAAQVLGISQPAISQSIRKLETSAGLQLFQRAHGRLIPTEEAQALMIDVDRLFIGMDAIEHRIKSLRQFGTGRLAIAVHPLVGNAFMPRVLAEFDLMQRDIRVSLRVQSSREVHQEVSAGLCDFGVMADEMPAAGLEHSEFLNERGVIAMPQGHPLARKSCISARDLANCEFIALNPEDSSRRRLEVALDSAQVALNVRVETAYLHTICNLVLRGTGIAFINPLAAIDFVGRGLVIRPFELDIRTRSLLVFRPGKPLSDTARQLLKVMRIQLARDLEFTRSYLSQ